MKTFLSETLSTLSRFLVFNTINCFLRPYLYRYYKTRLNEVSHERAIFFATRPDFGTTVQTVNYAYNWEQVRGPVCVVAITTHSRKVAIMAKCLGSEALVIAPTSMWIDILAKLFGDHYANNKIFGTVYARLTIDFPQAIYLYDQPSTLPGSEYYLRSRCYARYIPWFDKALKEYQESLPKDFVEAYQSARCLLDFHEFFYKDMLVCQLETDPVKPRLFFQEHLSYVKKALKIEKPYVILTINCKDYGHTPADRRTIHHPERYNVIIDALIKKGYTVVIQGREEQPVFQQRPGLVNYAKSPLTSVENDIALFSGCSFAIVSKTGSEIFGSLCNVPLLGLNYTELSVLLTAHRFRFCPKRLRKEGRLLNWKEFLVDPCFFDIGGQNFSKDSISYEEMSEDELLDALEEFLEMVDEPIEKWGELSSLQQEFKNALTPLHIDLYSTKGAPCNTYLQNLGV